LDIHVQYVQNLRQVKYMCYNQGLCLPVVTGNAHFLEETVAVLTKKII